jgi:ribose transport system substrate-binding protein
VWLVGCRGADNAGGAPKTLTIAVIPKGATHEHLKRVHIGADKAAAEFSAAGVPVRVVWNSPLREDDREQQVQLVEGFISQGINGLGQPRHRGRAGDRQSARSRTASAVVERTDSTERLSEWVGTV